MSSLVYTNAQLTKITAAASGDDYDTDTVGTDRWTGSEGITVREQELEATGNGRVDIVVKTRVEMPWTLGHLVVRGDILTYVDGDGTHTRTAGSVIEAKLTGRVRVLLEDA